MSEEKNPSLQRYEDFSEKVSAKFEEIRKNYPQEFQCRIGCHECCKPGLTINSLERERIKNHLQANTESLSEVQKLSKENPFKGKRCSLLTKEGACSIYEVRPIVCRSHGAPLQFKDPENNNFDKALRYRDICPLNFKNKPIDSLTPDQVLNLDTINTLLALLKKQFSAENEETRFPLSLESLL